jgi:hypothetical protein
MPKGIMVVQSSPAEGRENEYNEWYSQTHIPQILEIPGFVDARRFRVSGDGLPPGHKYLAVYELEAGDLAEPVAELRSRSTSGRMDRSDALAANPAAVITIYELID